MKKHHRFRDFFAGVLAAAFLMAIVLPAGASSLNKIIEVFTGVTIYIDGEKLNPTDVNGNPVDTFIYNGTTYIPLRAVSESLGESVKWDGSTRSVYIGDIPGQVEYLLNVCPPYKTGDYNAYHGCTVYAGETNTNAFYMCGVRYRNGLTLAGLGTDHTYASFNLNAQFESITMDIGFCDDSYYGNYPAGVAFFVDGKLVGEYIVQPDDYVKQITIPLNYGLQLKIVSVSGDNFGVVGLGNIIVNK